MSRKRQSAIRSLEDYISSAWQPNQIVRVDCTRSAPVAALIDTWIHFVLETALIRTHEGTHGTCVTSCLWKIRNGQIRVSNYTHILDVHSHWTGASSRVCNPSSICLLIASPAPAPWAIICTWKIKKIAQNPCGKTDLFGHHFPIESIFKLHLPSKNVNIDFLSLNTLLISTYISDV